MAIYPTILCGGTGSRLAPLSSNDFPKQFLKSSNKNDFNFLQKTILRLSRKLQEHLIIVTNSRYKDLVKESLSKININNAQIILEPEKRNTLPAVLTASLYAQKTDQDASILMLPSDHVINDTKSFNDSITRAQNHIHNSIITFGVKPNNPSNSYGYIELGENNNVKSFHEKPSKELAQKYIEQGNYFWNSGILLFNAKTLITESQKYQPETLSLLESSLSNSKKFNNIIELERKSFSKINANSIDHAILEKTDKTKMLPLESDWNDIGSLESYFLEYAKNQITSNIISTRPWGTFECLYEAKGIKAKKVIVNPNSSISLQKHQHRTEQWIILKGKADIINGDNEFTLNEGESTTIITNTKHRLSNSSSTALEVLEIQQGTYLEEDDIIRFEDNYGRA